jgi:hypothetical protein
MDLGDMDLGDIDVLSNDVYVAVVPYAQLAYPRRHAPVFRQSIPTLGASLARIETRLIFGELLPRIASAMLAGPIERARSSFIHGVKHLPVRIVRIVPA